MALQHSKTGGKKNQAYRHITLATEIAGLLAAAELAETNNEKGIAKYCRETADYWNDNIERWTYITDNAISKEVGVDGAIICVLCN